MGIHAHCLWDAVGLFRFGLKIAIYGALHFWIAIYGTLHFMNWRAGFLSTGE
tara:strand:+ start:316 stop:471 length:156 start_codon:yes stop_codon:yes gene_type:complete